MTTTQTTQTTVYLPNILLDETNYPTWLFRLESFLKGQNLYGFVDGTIRCPPQFVLASDGVANVINNEFVAWKTQDQSIVNMLGQTLSPVAMSCAVGSKSAAEMWANLKLKFAAPNRQNILQLKSNLQGLKKGSDNIETYLDKVKSARDALETVGVFLDDEDIVVVVLRGLPYEYAAIKTVIRAQFVTCSMGELKTLLKAAEVDIENEMQSSSSMTLTAMLAQNQASTSNVSTSSPASVHTASTSSSPVISTQSPKVPPGFSPLPPQPAVQSHSPPALQSPYIPIPALPYGFSPYTPFSLYDTSFPMAGLYAGRGRNNNFTGGRGNFGGAGRGSFFNRNNNGGFNTASGNAFNRNNNAGTFNRNNNTTGGAHVTCQLCGKVGHGARTCRSLNNYNAGGASSSNVECQYCGRDNHTADRCYYIIGFPGQQQQQQQTEEIQAMLAAATPNPQFWLADSGATNHMTSEVQLLNNVAPYNATDSVQVGQGAGQNTLPRTE
ncbi:hypothetical protein ABKV19_014637 [Rosa sericea]